MKIISGGQTGVEALNGLTPHNSEPTEDCWRGVVGVPFQLRAQLKDRQAINAIASQGIQSEQDAKAHGDAAP